MAVWLSVVSLLALFSVLIPLPWHWRVGNTATLCTIFWLATDDLYHLIESILWADNVLVKASVWCDIAIFFYIASAMGLPAASLCISHSLSTIASAKYSPPTYQDMRKRKVIELALCIALPILYSLMHMIVQGHRFDIVEELGCQAAVYWSWPAVFLYFFPPIIVSVIASVYAGLAIYRFSRQRSLFTRASASQNGLTNARFFRLMGLAITEMIAVLGLYVYVFVSNAKMEAPKPWISWDYVHADFGRIDQYPKALISSSSWEALVTVWLVIPVSSFGFFVFFGTSKEVRGEYIHLWKWAKARILPEKPRQSSSLVTPYMISLSPTSSRDYPASFKHADGNAISIKPGWNTSESNLALDTPCSEQSPTDTPVDPHYPFP